MQIISTHFQKHEKTVKKHRFCFTTLIQVGQNIFEQGFEVLGI
jgi:hypothetical protein